MHDGDEFIAWLDFDEGPGQLKIGFQYAEANDLKLTVDDFTLLKVIGQGSFGKVLQVRKNDTQRIYAIKSVRKAKIIARNEVLHTMTERSILAQVDHAFIVPLKFSFESDTKLYFVLAFVNGGELFTHLNHARVFDINRARFYTAELLCALEYLHDFGIIYRDLKPENILLDYEGHIALCDFGLCKLEMKDEDKTDTFCGTPEYMAPEIITGDAYNKTVDWWTLGTVLYEMLTGMPPFYDEDKEEMYRKIISMDLYFPPALIAPAAKALLQGLLDCIPAQRLGAKGAGEIKAHAFFKGIDWHKLVQRRYVPSFKPNVVSNSPSI
jgi:serum/glucocorticoid-regulated kinase 2